MDFQGHIQPSEGCITGKESKKTYFNTAEITPPCQLHKTAAVKFEAKHFKPSLKPMDFIAMDLIGEFHLPSSQGNRYTLTRVCMLTGFTWCIPIKSKKAADVARACMQHVYSVLGGSTKILTDNGTEFSMKS